MASSDGDQWVFAFGSLMWLPGFKYTAQRPARIFGWHRGFSVISTKSWGTKDLPGLVVALHPGGSCLGTAFRVAGAEWPQALDYLKFREQAYRFVEVKANLPEGPVPAITFATDPTHKRTAADLDLSEIAGLIRQGKGEVGTSLGYFNGIRNCLAEMGWWENRLLDRISAELSKFEN